MTPRIGVKGEERLEDRNERSEPTEESEEGLEQRQKEKCGVAAQRIPPVAIKDVRAVNSAKDKFPRRYMYIHIVEFFQRGCFPLHPLSLYLPFIAPPFCHPLLFSLPLYFLLLGQTCSRNVVYRSFIYTKLTLRRFYSPSSIHPQVCSSLARVYSHTLSCKQQLHQFFGEIWKFGQRQIGLLESVGTDL